MSRKDKAFFYYGKEKLHFFCKTPFLVDKKLAGSELPLAVECGLAPAVYSRLRLRVFASSRSRVLQANACGENTHTLIHAGISPHIHPYTAGASPHIHPYTAGISPHIHPYTAGASPQKKGGPAWGPPFFSPIGG